MHGYIENHSFYQPWDLIRRNCIKKDFIQNKFPYWEFSAFFIHIYYSLNLLQFFLWKKPKFAEFYSRKNYYSEAE